MSDQAIEPKRVEVTQTHIYPDCRAIEAQCDGHVVRLEGPTPEAVMRLYKLYQEQGGPSGG